MMFDGQLCRKPDFRRVYEQANEILVCTAVIDDFPFPAKRLIKEQTDIALRTFDKACFYDVDIRQFGSESAVLTEKQGAYIIFYNQTEPNYRIRFSMMHELGHYLLGHEMNLSINDPLYGVQETEANCFAAQVLMPEQLLRECSKRGVTVSEEFIRDAFGVSADAARIRKQTLAKTNYEWRSREETMFDDIILSRFAAHLDSIASKTGLYSYSLEEDDERERERSEWLYTRSRWS